MFRAYLAYLNAFQIGFVAGMRSLTAPAVVSHKLSNTHPNPLPGSKLHFLTSSKTATTLKALAGAELIGDKVPNVPDRIEPEPLTMRIASGATCGAALSQAEGKPAKIGAVIGGFGAVAGSYTFFYLRQWLTMERGLPDPAVALAEDALAITIGWLTVDAIELSAKTV